MKTWIYMLAIVLGLGATPTLAHADAGWGAILAKARGETVY